MELLALNAATTWTVFAQWGLLPGLAGFIILGMARIVGNARVDRTYDPHRSASVFVGRNIMGLKLAEAIITGILVPLAIIYVLLVELHIIEPFFK